MVLVGKFDLHLVSGDQFLREVLKSSDLNAGAREHQAKEIIEEVPVGDLEE